MSRALPFKIFFGERPTLDFFFEVKADINSPGIPTDPTTVSVYFFPPGGDDPTDKITFLYGNPDLVVIRIATGHYRVDGTYAFEIEGEWEVRAVGTGACAAVIEEVLIVRKTKFH